MVVIIGWASRACDRLADYSLRRSRRNVPTAERPNQATIVTNYDTGALVHQAARIAPDDGQAKAQNLSQSELIPKFERCRH